MNKKQYILFGRVLPILILCSVSKTLFAQEADTAKATLPLLPWQTTLQLTTPPAHYPLTYNLTTPPPTGWQRFVKKISDLHFLAIPFPSYSPETNWSFGLAGAYYFTAPGQTRLSDIGFDGAYTLNKQWNININSTIYFGGNNRWTLWTRLGYRKFPDYYYGQGNRPEQLLKQRLYYDSDNAYLTLQPQYRFSKSWIVGADVALYYDNARADTTLQVPGLNERILLLGIGGLISYDSRDEVYYPSKGIFFKATATYYDSPLNETYRMGKFVIDFRHYLTLYRQLIFVYQLRADMAVGKQIPFQLQPTIGGQDVLRGFRRGQYRDDAYFALQGELRIPIWKVIRGTVFAGIGDVYNLSDWQWAPPKVSYGLGLRVAINKAKVNIRFDVARTNINPSWKGDGWSFYLTVKEAL